MAAMKENTRKIFDYIKAHNSENLTAKDVAEAVGLTDKSVNGSFTSFQKKGLGERIPVEVTDAEGKAKTIKYLRLTDAGMAFDPDAEVPADAE